MCLAPITHIYAPLLLNANSSTFTVTKKNFGPLTGLCHFSATFYNNLYLSFKPQPAHSTLHQISSIGFSHYVLNILKNKNHLNRLSLALKTLHCKRIDIKRWNNRFKPHVSTGSRFWWQFWANLEIDKFRDIFFFGEGSSRFELTNFRLI